MTSGNTNIGESGKSGKILHEAFSVIIRDREFNRIRGTRYSVFIAVLYEPDESGKLRDRNDDRAAGEAGRI